MSAFKVVVCVASVIGAGVVGAVIFIETVKDYIKEEEEAGRNPFPDYFETNPPLHP